VADIMETAVAAIRDLIATESHETAVPSHHGAKYIHEHGKPPRIVWVPKKSDYLPAKRAGKSPQAEIGIDVAKYDVHVWAASFENARILSHNIIAAARRLYPTKLVFKGWDPNGGSTHDYATEGELFILDVEAQVRVDEFIAPTATVAAYKGNAIAELPAGDETYTATSQA